MFLIASVVGAGEKASISFTREALELLSEKLVGTVVTLASDASVIIGKVVHSWISVDNILMVKVWTANQAVIDYYQDLAFMLGGMLSEVEERDNKAFARDLVMPYLFLGIKQLSTSKNARILELEKEIL